MSDLENQKTDLNRKINKLKDDIINELRLILKEVDENGKPIDPNDVIMAFDISSFLKKFKEENVFNDELKEYVDGKLNLLCDGLIIHYKRSM